MLKLKFSYLNPCIYIEKDRPYSKSCQCQQWSYKSLISGESSKKRGSNLPQNQLLEGEVGFGMQDIC